MPAPEPLMAMLGELAAMSPEDRAVILGALTRKERDKLDRLAPAMSAELPSGPNISPWLAVYIETARRGEATMTPATRELLLRAVGAPVREPAAPGRSLAGAFGGLLAARGAR